MWCERLKRGDDLLLKIQEIADQNNIECGVVLSAVGCVSTATVRDASGVNFQTINQDMEIISVMGTVSKNRTHLHVSFSKEDLSVVGGHLVCGCIVNTTCELVIAPINGVKIQTEFDSETGYDELIFEKSN
ncbi:MAG: PPC domain-containing DNA-binding protein [Bacillota bacterium]